MKGSQYHNIPRRLTGLSKWDDGRDQEAPKARRILSVTKATNDGEAR